jgi:hypothetical protein
VEDVEVRRSEGQQACAHLRVVYTTEQIEGGLTRGWWACDLCHREFILVASAESAWVVIQPEAAPVPADHAVGA